ncbi:MAG: glycosyltransferase family 4 protein, partial [archaeon]
FNLFVFFNALKKDFDLVYLSASSMLPAALLLSKIKRIPLVYHEFNHNPWIGGKDFLFDFLSKESVKASDLTVTPSLFIKNKIIEKIPSVKKKVIPIPPALDLNEFPKAFPNKEKKIIFIGRILEHKGIHYLIESMKELSKTNPEWVLSVIGPKGEFNKISNKYFSRIKKMIKDFGLEKKIVFKGQLLRKELIKELSTSSLLVFPSSEEAFGLVLIEANTCWTPCIAFDSGATKEIIEHNKNGFIVNKGNQKELTEMILKLVKDKNLMKRFFINSRKTAEEKFALNKRIGEWIKYLNIKDSRNNSLKG